MSVSTIAVESLFDGKEFLSNQIIRFDENKILSIENGKAEEKYLPGLLSAGFIDIQVNGGGGVLFNDSLNRDALLIIAKAHQQFGTTGWLPTLITDSLDKMKLASEALIEAKSMQQSGILGIHFEGPHLSTEKRGVHSKDIIRTISDQEIEIYCRQDLGQVMITVAPENVSPEIISLLVSKGVIVCLGHSNASYEQVELALEAGARGFTHLFNAMSGLNARQPGMIGAALSNREKFYGIILDGIHVHSACAKMAFRANPNAMLVTDAMPPVGSDKTTFEFFGETVTRNGDQLTNHEGRLAGSALDMASAVFNAEKMLSIDRGTAINLATKIPAKFLNIENQFGQLKQGFKPNMTLTNNKGEVSTTWINGIQVV